MSILIRDVEIEGLRKDILVEGDRIAKISDSLIAPGASPSRAHFTSPLGPAVQIIDAAGMAAVPSLVNAHSHSAMTLLRSVAEDLDLDEWLKAAIWPLEAKLTEEDIYWGARLAALEMIKTGTTLCHDMYLNPVAQARAARDSGMRFIVNYALIDGMDEEEGARQRVSCETFFDNLPDFGPLVRFNLAAHSVYATCEPSLRWLGEFGRRRGLSCHIHLAETKDEVDACHARRGMSPAFYLDSVGLLGPNLFAAHALWLDEADFDLLARRGVVLVHNPVSNMKLASGPAYDYEGARSRGMTTLLGTDGAASNNSLDLFSVMKIAALLQKQHYRDSKRLPVRELFESASILGHEAFADGAGRLAEGYAADFLLIDLDKPGMVPNHDLVANLVYSGGGNAVDTVICGGKILMRSGKVEGEGEVLEEAARHARNLVAGRSAFPVAR